MAKITWADKTALNPQPSIARENKCTDADLNEIKSVVNTNDDNVGDLTSLDTTDKSSIVNAVNELLDGEVYSTNEIKTNQTWINGKPIYRKVVELTVGTEVQLSSNIKVFDYRSYFYGGDGRLMDAVWVQGSSITVLFSIDGNNKCTWQGDYSTWRGRPAYVILQYTKTTD